jgi:hypothetical protein
MASTYNVRKSDSSQDAKIFAENGEEVAEIKREKDSQFRLLSKSGVGEWILSNVIDGKHHRFSLAARSAQDTMDGEPALTVRDNIFKHRGRFYMLASHPAGKTWSTYVNNPVRYISRLDNFPFTNVAELNEHRHNRDLRHKLKRFRGVAVGEASGLGATSEGHSVKVNDELDDIGLFIAAASYLMYASA